MKRVGMGTMRSVPEILSEITRRVERENKKPGAAPPPERA
jgi:hypothetical protein